MQDVRPGHGGGGGSLGNGSRDAAALLPPNGSIPVRRHALHVGGSAWGSEAPLPGSISVMHLSWAQMTVREPPQAQADSVGPSPCGLRRGRRSRALACGTTSARTLGSRGHRDAATCSCCPAPGFINALKPCRCGLSLPRLIDWYASARWNGVVLRPRPLMLPGTFGNGGKLMVWDVDGLDMARELTSCRMAVRESFPQVCADTLNVGESAFATRHFWGRSTAVTFYSQMVK